MGGVDDPGLIDVLARSGLSDDDYTRAVESLRAWQAEMAAGRRLAAAVMAAASYQPQSVVAALGAYYSAAPVPV